ncbi:MAG TPA: bacteriohopanetetrol glucosamine biosynthesis glycosyltransferase HpnI, partial [Thermodesulfobacteriota bacterium]|nr:bacteriohopanetetrol glucosamine biosynthesis glycosyltransferase HpnI [Thermodesulfobacteriota bacterium]
AVVYQLAAYVALVFFLKRRFPRLKKGLAPGVSLLKPVKGLEADTYNCLESFVKQEYPNLKVLFGVADPSDPVLPTLRELQQKNPEVDIQVFICPEELGINPKISTLRQLMPHVDNDILVISDSDVQVRPNLLKRLIAALQQPGVGLATCLYRSGPVCTTGAALEAMSISADFIPSVAVAYYVEGINFALGAVMALSRKVLESIGGLTAIADYLADDYQLGYRVSQTGLKVFLLPYVVETLGGKETIADYLTHQFRWARTYRVCRPKGFFAYGITFALPWSLLAWLASGLAPWGGSLVLICLLVRLTIASIAEYTCLRGRLPGRYLVLLPLKDLLSFGLWISSFLGDRVRWKGRAYKVRPDGRLEKLKEA